MKTLFTVGHNEPRCNIDDDASFASDRHHPSMPEWIKQSHGTGFKDEWMHAEPYEVQRQKKRDRKIQQYIATRCPCHDCGKLCTGERCMRCYRKYCKAKKAVRRKQKVSRHPFYCSTCGVQMGYARLSGTRHPQKLIFTGDLMTDPSDHKSFCDLYNNSEFLPQPLQKYKSFGHHPTLEQYDKRRTKPWEIH